MLLQLGCFPRCNQGLVAHAPCEQVLDTLYNAFGDALGVQTWKVRLFSDSHPSSSSGVTRRGNCDQWHETHWPRSQVSNLFQAGTDRLIALHNQLEGCWGHLDPLDLTWLKQLP